MAGQRDIRTWTDDDVETAVTESTDRSGVDRTLTGDALRPLVALTAIAEQASVKPAVAS